MDADLTFYQTLSTVSFTLLALWFTVLKLGAGEWQGDERHRGTLHIGLHFFLPGVAGLAALLAGPLTAGGLVWRIAFVVIGVVGVIESIGFAGHYRHVGNYPGGRMRFLDIALYAGVMVTAFVGPTEVFRPLQLAGLTTGALFIVGLSYVWAAFAERGEAQPAPAPVPAPAPAPPCRYGGICHQAVRNPAIDVPAQRCGVCPAPVRTG